MLNTKTQKILTQTLNGNITDKVPFWFMRQAGRYLPEYKELRAKAGGFLDLVYHPERASEVTLQPIRRFGMNGAILFSDILVIPQALGQPLKFETGEGPKLEPIIEPEDLNKLDLDQIDKILNPIYETVSLTAEKLKTEGFDQTTLIGFAGAPWTVACYMVEGGGSKTFEATKNWAYRDPETFQKLIDILNAATIHYLSRQIDAGAEAVQIFDSWSGVLDEENFKRWVIEPTKIIVDALKEKYSDIQIIGFPRDSGAKAISYATQTGVNTIGLDYAVPVKWARDNLQNLLPVQGNLDPVSLLVGGEQMKKNALHILETFADRPFIFNLGHGVVKETPIKHVEDLSRIIQDFKR